MSLANKIISRGDKKPEVLVEFENSYLNEGKWMKRGYTG